MSNSTNFVNLQTTIQAPWLNDVNTAVFTDLGGPGNLATVAGSALIGTPPLPNAPGSTVQAQLAQLSNAAVSAGVSSCNTRTGAVSLSSGDVVSALGYTPVNSTSPAFSGVPTAPTASPGNNTLQLATTAFVQAAVTASTTGVSSFNTRTGAITLTNTDVANTFTSTNVTKNLIWNADTGAADAGDSSSIYIQRKASYTGGTAGKVNSALYIQTYTPPANTSFEWGITSETFSYSAVSGGGSGAVPQNVAVNGTIWKRGSSPAWGGNFCSNNQYMVLESSTAGPAIGTEINVSGVGTDNSAQTIGSHIAGQVCPPETFKVSTQYYLFQLSKPTTANGYYYKCVIGGTTASTEPTWPTTVGATVVSGTSTWECIEPKTSLYCGLLISGDNASFTSSFQYGVRVMASGGTKASFYSDAVSSTGFGMQLAGSYAVAVDTSVATNSTGIAFRMKAGDAICFDGTSNYKMKLNVGAGLLEFYNGATRHGYIDIGSGADVNFNAAGGGSSGVSSFNSRTGAVTLTSGDVTSALGYTPANSSSVVDLSSSQTVGGTKAFSSSVTLSGGAVFQNTLVGSAGSTIQWASAGGNVVFGSGKTDAFYLRILVDGTTYYLQVKNP